MIYYKYILKRKAMGIDMKDGFIKTAAATPEIRVADCVYNAGSIINTVKKAETAGVKLLALPELCITGYTCGDLFLQPKLLKSAETEVCRIIKETETLDILYTLGMPIKIFGTLYNCAVVIYKGDILGIVPKANIPNYGEFYEKRHFSPAPDGIVTVNILGRECPFGTNLIFSCAAMPEFSFAIEICEDLWVPQSPSGSHAVHGAALILNLSASDEVVSKSEYRRNLVAMQSAKYVCGYIYADAGEGESTTDMVFAGHNIIAENGTVLAESVPFENEITISETDVYFLDSERRKMNIFNKYGNDGYKYITFDMDIQSTSLTRKFAQCPFIPSDSLARSKRCRDILLMQAAGLKKRLICSHAECAVVGISGGLDSCLALLVTVKALDLLKRSRKDALAITMPCFGTTSRTKSNAIKLCECLGVSLREVDISKSVTMHLKDINHDINDHSVTYENAQARERTQVLMDTPNKSGGIVIGTGDLSELALGWATYNGDHMSMYGVNSSIPKTLVRYLVQYYADSCGNEELKNVLYDILDTPVSPELLPAEDDAITQKTEDIVGPYTLHDFYLYYGIRRAYSPSKVYRVAKYTFGGIYENGVLLKWLKNFYRRFFAQQFKRSCLPDGPKVGSVTLSPRGDWRMPSDASAEIWLSEINDLQE